MEKQKESIYEVYGKLMVKKELLDSQINEVKKAISADLNKKPEEPKAKTETKKE